MRPGRARLVALFGAAMVLLTWSLAHASREKTDYQDKPIPQWREGPVRYIITKWEDQEYKDLKIEEDRARFIEGFWRRRDPTPESPGNEFRADFWKRVRDANNLYREQSSVPGWRTDMGKMHILMGPPDEITRDLMAEGHRGTVVWTYRNSNKPGVGPNVVLAFARDATGEFRLSTQPTKDSDPKQGSPLAYQPSMGTTAAGRNQLLRAQALANRLFNLTDPLIRQAGGPFSANPLALITELSKLQQPPREWELRETVTTQEFFGAVPIRARADFFRTTTSRTRVLLTAGVKSSAVHYRSAGGRESPDVVFYGRILDLTGNDLVASLEKDSDFSPARENDSAGIDSDLVFQGSALLEPGSYKALITVQDRVGGRVGSYNFPLTVPSFPAADLSLSSLLLARGIEPTTTADAPEDAFVIGSLRVMPRLTQTFAAGDDMAFYYQIYGASKDPGTGQPNLDVDYAFLTVEAEKLQDLGHVVFADQHNEAHGYALSLKEWPKGPYMLRVLVTDKIAHATASRDLVFEVR